LRGLYEKGERAHHAAREAGKSADEAIEEGLHAIGYEDPELNFSALPLAAQKPKISATRQGETAVARALSSFRNASLRLSPA